MLTLTLMFILPASQMPLFSRHFRPLQGLHVVKQLPETMVAGSTYTWQVSFVNPKSEEGYMNITLEITEEQTDVGLGEFMVEGTLISYDNPPRPHQYLNLTFTETAKNGVGIFQNQTQIQERFNRITLRISSVPNLMPGRYTFTLHVTSHEPKAFSPT